MNALSQSEETGKLLVIDDQAYFREKISLSLRKFGYDVTTADSGLVALDLCSYQNFDVILLDIEMPEMDGYAVLTQLKANPDLNNIPVIVISALEDNRSSVVKAIELGAEDFLTKNFEQQLLKARVSACIRKKRHRDQELDSLRAFKKLTDVTDLLEQGTYNPSKLGLQSIAARDDSVGTFATVFTSMAQNIYNRERRLRKQVRAIKGLLLLILTGSLLGLDIPVAKIMGQFNAPPLGVAIWLSVVACLLTLPYAIYTKDIPKFSWPQVKFYLFWGFCTCILGDVFLLMATDKLNASVVAIIMVLEVLFVFAYSAITKIEQATYKRFAGLIIGLIGIILAVYAQANAGDNIWIWALVALGVPIGFAAIDILMASSNTNHIKPTTTLGLASFFGLLIMIPIAWYQDAFVSLSIVPGKFELGIILWGALTVITLLCCLQLIRTAGTVFGSQAAYVMTLAGIFWSMVLLGESLSVTTWVALGIICVGLLLVEPKHEAEAELPQEVLDRLNSSSNTETGLQNL